MPFIDVPSQSEYENTNKHKKYIIMPKGKESSGKKGGKGEDSEGASEQAKDKKGGNAVKVNDNLLNDNL